MVYIAKTDCVYCWQFLNCPEETRSACGIYKEGYCDKCWLFVDRFTEGCVKRKEGCYNCPWYKEKNP